MPERTAIRATGLLKRYGTLAVLDGVDLQIEEAEVVCLLGPSGSGKTTLLRCLAMLEPIQAGEIEMHGEVIVSKVRGRSERRAARRVRADVGMVFQHFNLWPHMTALENVAEGPLRVKKMASGEALVLARALLGKVGLGEKEGAYPAQLSGGQQQRVAIARALAMSPKVLLFDEPTSALDPELRREVLTVMRTLAAEGMTMLVATHELGFARNVSSRVVFMTNGRIVEDTPAQQFFTSPQTDRARQFLELLAD
jgi:ABC-type polar amino acid transport system ATPase subunit